MSRATETWGGANLAQGGAIFYGMERI